MTRNFVQRENKFLTYARDRTGKSGKSGPLRSSGRLPGRVRGRHICRGINGTGEERTRAQRARAQDRKEGQTEKTGNRIIRKVRTATLIREVARQGQGAAYMPRDKRNNGERKTPPGPLSEGENNPTRKVL